MRSPAAWTVWLLVPLTLVLLVVGGNLMGWAQSTVVLAPSLERVVVLTGFALLEVAAVLAPVLLFTGLQRIPLGEVAPFHRLGAIKLLGVVLGTLGLALVITYLQSAFADLTHLDYPQELQDLIRARGPLDWLLMILTVALAPALVEETFTRGYVQSALVPRLGLVAGIGLSALIFAILHWTPAGAPTYLLLGVWLSVLRWRTGTLVGCVAAHATNNVLAILQENFVPESFWGAHLLWVLPLGVGLTVLGAWWALKAPSAPGADRASS